MPFMCPNIRAIVMRWLLLLVPVSVSSAITMLDLANSIVRREDENAIAAVLPQTTGEIDTTIAALQSRSADIETKWQTLKSPNSNHATFAASSQDRREFERVLQDWAAALDQHTRHLRMLKEVRRIANERNSDEDIWRGFPRQPSILEIEQLTDTISARRLELRTAEMFLSIVEGEISRHSARLAENHKLLRIATDKSPASGVADLQRQWSLRLAERKVHAEEAAVEASETGRLVTWEAINSLGRHIKFLERKVATARTLVQITRADVGEMIAAIHVKKIALRQMLTEATASDTHLRASLDDKTDCATNRGTNCHPYDTYANSFHCELPVDLAAQVRNARLETSAHKIELYRGFLQLTEYAQNIWEDRLWAADHHPLSEIRSRHNHYSELADNLRQWKRLLEQSLSAGSEHLLRQVLRAEDRRISDPERSAAAQIATALRERANLDLQAVGALAFTEDLVVRLHAELSDQVNRASPLKKLGSIYESIRAAFRHVWNIELYIAEDSIIAAGKKISVPRSITVGKVVIALAIFLVGLFAARYVYRFCRHLLSETPARALAAVFAILSLVIAMSSVRIPWTVFAFMGGALAIGVGFGAQTLVNNFISGLILQGERTLRVGDIVEVDDQRGKIMRIGFRQSLIARGDGSELLVPNSQFIEKKLVNWTLTDDLVRQCIAVNIAYGESIEDATLLIEQAVAENLHLENAPAPQVLFDDFGDRALVIRIIFWTHLCPSVDVAKISSDLRRRINVLLENAGIATIAPKPETGAAMRTGTSKTL